jgi:HlyD family secretion protein
MTKRKKSNWWMWLMGAALVILLVAAIIKGRSQQKGEEVEVEEVLTRDIVERVTASGKIFPEKEVKISSDVSGEIVKLYVKEGDSIKVGQPLAKIDPEAYTSSVERGQASLDNTKAQLAVSKSSVKNAIAQKAQIEAQLSNAEQIYNRNKTLFEDGVIAKQDLETAETNLRALQANLRSAQASIESGEESVRAAEYSVKSMAASLKELRTNLNRTSILAPTNGVVSMLNVEEGERVVGTIQMTGTELMRVSNFSTMEVQVEVSENDILRVDVGDEVDIELDAYAERKFKGHVSEIANSAANMGMSASLSTEQVTNFIVKIRVEQDSYSDLIDPSKIFPLRPGMSASVEILTEKVVDALAIPIQCVTARERDEDSNKKKSEIEEEDLMEVVFRVQGDTVSMVEVTTGIQDDDYIQVLQGLNKDDVVVSGPYNVIAKELEQGDLITIKKDDDKE